MNRYSQFSDALFTDLYELTMAQAYWRAGVTDQATFSLFFRGYPRNRSYYVFAGLEAILNHLEDFQFTGADIDYLRTLDRFDEEFIEYLAELRFTGDVRSMKEGTVCFGDEPVLEVRGPIIEAQIAETFLLNQATFQSTVATKASRVVHAAAGRSVVDFAARRTQGTDAAMKVARTGYLAGYHATSNVKAGAVYGIPVVGTMAHSFIMAFDSEIEAFRAYTHAFPDYATLLVDTYDTLRGVRNAIEVGRELESEGHVLRGVRIDSGDLAHLGREARKILDEEGFKDVGVFASGGLDEYEVDRLVRDGTPFEGYGVGTKAGTSADAPYLDSAYKLVEYAGRPVLKLSSKKQSLPGCKQVYRTYTSDGSYDRDTISLVSEEAPSMSAKPLLENVMTEGARINGSPALNDLRDEHAREFTRVPARYKALQSAPRYPVEVSQRLKELQREVVREVRDRELGE
ncbi:MAG: nicotinate phosphoribosyltransferase [Dehalococcoidia bacterium]|nr:nicotinate phosphoribosyltransferase [Dehalococcoidia bacterium]MSQ35112.1 nicotinate phosphoribosyltransferase [Dehalococcoidia bacterium]